jgi:hypothetical protein
VDGGLDDGEVIPAIGSENFEGVSENYIRGGRTKVEMLCGGGCNKTTR